MNYCGIDVGGKELVVRIIRNGRLGKVKTFSNTTIGHAGLIKYISGKSLIRVCLEATGIYHQDITIALHRAPNIEVMLLNPKVSRNFAVALHVRYKTDKVDAAILAEYATRMPFKAWIAPSDNTLKLRAFSRRIGQVTKLKSKLKNQIHALSSTNETPSEILEDCQEQIKFYEKSLETLSTLAMDVIKSDDELNGKFELIITIKGIAEKTAILLLGELLILPKGLSKKQWVAYAGLDPRICQSGTSVSLKPRISKAGNGILRQGLFMPALSSKQHEPHIKAFFDHLVNDLGKKRIQAICAVMRKLLHAIHGMFKSGKAFDGELFYKIKET